MLADQDRPSTPNDAYKAIAPDVQLIRDLLAGTRRMKDQYKLYIQKWAKETPENYKRRATSAKLYGGLGRSLSASVGMLFARPPALSEDWPAAMEEHWENLDGQGTHGDVFCKRLAWNGIADGLFAILVDFPPVPDGVAVTLATEEALNLRPKWAAYQRLDILSWRTAIVRNVTTLTQVVLREAMTRANGRFGTITVPVYRVCTLDVAPHPTELGAVVCTARWELLEEKVQGNGDIVLVSHGSGVFRDRDGAAFDVIPLAVGYTGQTDAPMTAHPPLTDLAYCNLEHYQIANDLRYYERLCAVPQPTLTGALTIPPGMTTAPPVSIGPNQLVHLADKDSKFEWAELKGTTLDKLRASLQEKKDEMGELGAAFLAKKTRGVETAEAKRLDATAENATLATSAQGTEDAFNQALMFHARYLGIPKEQAPTVSVNRDFEGLTIDAPTMIAFATLHKETGFPVRLILEQLQAGGKINPDADLDEIEAEMMAAAAAQAEQDRLNAQAQKDAMGQAA